MYQENQICGQAIAADRQSQISEAKERLFSAIKELDYSLSNLVGRVQTVVRPLAPEPAGDSAKEQGYSCQLASEIQQATAQIMQLARIAQSTEQRVEL